MIHVEDLSLSLICHNGCGVAREAENLFGFGSAGVEGGGADEAGGGGSKNISGMEGSRGDGGEAEFFGIESTGFGDAFAGENFGEESVIGGEVDVACLGTYGEGGSIGADAWIDDGDDNGARGKSAG